MIVRWRVSVAIAACVTLAACGGGGGGGSSLPPAPGPVVGPTQSVTVALVIPDLGPSSLVRRPQFVSSATNSATIKVTQGSQSVSAVVDLSASSNACAVASGKRTCNTQLAVPAGVDLFTITTYDLAPVGGAIPGTAHVLGIGSSSVTVNAQSAASPISIFIGGEIAAIGATSLVGSLPANGNVQTSALVIAPTDFGNKAITAGTSDPYANPIIVSIAETGDSGHATLILNGTPSGTSAIVRHSSDAVTVRYDGGGKPGYFFTVSLSANGASTQSFSLSPLIVSTSGSLVHSFGLNGTVTALTVAIGEANAVPSNAFTATAATCTNIAAASAVSGSGAAATFTLNGGTNASASGCTITVKDSLNTSVVLPVSNTPITGGVTIGGVTITEYGVTAPTGVLTVGSDGNIWFTEPTINAIGYISTDGTVQNEFGADSQLLGITTGPDGALWLTDGNIEGAVHVTTALPSIAAPYPLPVGGCPQDITSDANGLLWMTDSCNSNGLWSLTVGGGFTAIPIAPSGSAGDLAIGPDGAIWFTEGGNIGRYDPVSTSFTETAVPGGNSANFIAAGPDNAIWFTAFGGATPILGRIPMNGTGPFAVTSFNLVGTAQPAGITAGVDNAMWYVDQGTNAVGRISTSAGNAMTSYTIPTANAQPGAIVRGPDGSLWFTETNVSNIVHVIP